MTRLHLLALGLLLSTPALAGPEEESCTAAIAEARAFAASLPADHLSRRFAEHELATAELEMGAGEVDECPELVERARHIIETKPYVLRPGEQWGLPPPEPAR